MSAAKQLNQPTSNVIPLFQTIKKDRKTTRMAADPIKDHDVIIDVEQHLKSTGRYGYRNWMIFMLGIHIGRRCGDLLSLKVKDVFNGEAMKESVSIIEQKTGKLVAFSLSTELQQAIFDYLYSLPTFSMNDYLFRSQKGECLTRRSYGRILEDVRHNLDLTFRLSTHSIRKTWAYHLYQKYRDVTFEGGYDIVDRLQYMLNHSTRAMTLRYLGIDDETAKAIYMDLHLGTLGIE